MAKWPRETRVCHKSSEELTKGTLLLTAVININRLNVGKSYGAPVSRAQEVTLFVFHVSHLRWWQVSKERRLLWPVPSNAHTLLAVREGFYGVCNLRLNAGISVALDCPQLPAGWEGN